MWKFWVLTAAEAVLFLRCEVTKMIKIVVIF